MPSTQNVEKLNEIKEILSKNGNFVVTTYSGMKVEQMAELRRAVRDTKGRTKIVKNNLLHIALKESELHREMASRIDGDLNGPIAVSFAGVEFPAVANAVLEYSKRQELVAIKGGCLDGRYLPKSDVVAVANLPSREQLLAIIARGLNAPAQQIASGVNQIMASLARAIQAVGEKNG